MINLIQKIDRDKILFRSSGQVALVVLLISAAVMTVGLSLSKKTVIDTTIDTNEEQLKQAFNTAESGIDYFLGTGSTQYVSSDNVSIANVKVKNVGQGATINYDQVTLVNNSQEYWLVAHAADGSIDYANYYQGNSLSICVANSYNGALKVDYFYLDNALSHQVYRMGYNFNLGYVSGFTDLNPLPGTGGCIVGYREVDLSLPGVGERPMLLSVKPLRSGVKMYLLGSGASFPVQGIELSSVGMVGDVSTGVSRKINVMRLYQVPGFVLEAVTTYGSVLSN